MKGKDPPSLEKGERGETGDRLELSVDATVAEMAPRTSSLPEFSVGAAPSLPMRESPAPPEEEPLFPAWVPPEMLRIEHGRYELEVEHARGGLGRVWIARDLRFGRRVAIKELLVPNRKAVARFVREATVTAQLQHPSIIPVYDAGRWSSGELFYAMKLISGRSLREMAEEARTLDERLALIPHILAVADAMAYAHSHRIIHRDLKPSNVMIGEFGETVVIDWGLAKQVSETGAFPEDEPWEEIGDDLSSASVEEDLTIVGSVLGTPQYMPPEQACGEAVDERADVYAIGALLFTLMAGQAPYAGTTPIEILAKVKQAEPSLFKALPAGVPKDLEAILRKAMAPKPVDRYRTARELAEDLRRFLQGQLVNAHEYSRLTILWRWLARHRAVALFAALLAGVSAYSVRRIVHERRVALDRSNDLVLLHAQTALERDPTQALGWLKTLPAGAVDEGKVRDLALDALARGVARHVFHKDEGRLTYGVGSPDGRWLALADSRSLFIWDMKDNRVAARLPLQREVARMSFSPDGKTLAFTGWESSTLRLWEHASGATRELPGGISVIDHIVFSSDGRWLAASRAGTQVELIELATGERRVFGDHMHNTWLDVQLSPDGRRLAYAGTGGKIYLVEVGSGARRSLQGDNDARALAFSPDGQLLATGDNKGTLWLWDLTEESRRPLRGHTHDVDCLQFARDGRRLVSAGADGTVRLWEVGSGAGQVLGEHVGGATWATFSSDSQVVASAGTDGLVRLWFLATGDRRILRGHTRPLVRVQFLGDGAHLMSVSVDRTTRVWQLLPQGAPAQVLYARNWITRVAFSPDERYLVAGDLDGLVWRWNRFTGEATAWSGHHRKVLGVAFSPDSQMVASASLDGTVRLWDAASGVSRVLSGPTSGLQEVAFAPDGRLLASAGPDGTLWLWDVATATRQEQGQGQHQGLGQDQGPARGRTLPAHQGEARSLSFSPNSRLIASAGTDGRVLLTDVATGQSRTLLGLGQAVPSVSFSHSGRWVVSGGSDGTVQQWDVATGTARLLGRQNRGIRSVTFSPDDRWVAAAGEDEIVLLCQPETGLCRQLVGHTERISKVDFSPDGRLLASAGHDRAVRLWDVASGRVVGLIHHDEAVTQVAFSPDGHRLASAGADGTARLWSVPGISGAPVEQREFRRWLDKVTTAVMTSRNELITP